MKDKCKRGKIEITLLEEVYWQLLENTKTEAILVIDWS